MALSGFEAFVFQLAGRFRILVWTESGLSGYEIQREQVPE